MVRTYKKGVRRKEYFYFFRHDFENLELHIPHLCSDKDNFAKLTKSVGWSGEELRMQFMWLQNQGNSEYHGSGETVCVNFADFRRAIEESERSGEEITILDLVVKFPEIEFQGSRNLQNVVSNKSIRKKLFSFLDQNFRWPSAKKIRIFNDYEPYDFCFEEELYDDSVKGIFGGIVYHANSEKPNESRYAIHT